MDIGAVFVALALLVVTMPFLVRPYKKSKVSKENEKIEMVDPIVERKNLLMGVRDLDFDYKTGKVDEHDYKNLRSDLLNRVAVIDAKFVEDDAAIEEEIASRRKNKGKTCSSGGKGCPNCQGQINIDDLFCPYCGTGFSLFCAACGEKLVPNARFCAHCGTSVAIQQVA
jgi:hypothetical protein